MTAIKIQGWMTPPSIAEALAFAGQIVHVCVGGELRGTGTPWFELFRFAGVRSVRERSSTDRTCSHCGQDAQIAFAVAWESNVSDRPPEVCELCLDGLVTDGGDTLSFRERQES